MNITKIIKPCCESMDLMAGWGYFMINLVNDDVVANLWTAKDGKSRHLEDIIQYCPYCGEALEVMDGEAES